MRFGAGEACAGTYGEEVFVGEAVERAGKARGVVDPPLKVLLAVNNAELAADGAAACGVGVLYPVKRRLLREIVWIFSHKIGRAHV